MSHPMQLFRVSFMPILSDKEGADGKPQPVGSWMTFATAPSAAEVGKVVAHFLPDLYSGGCDIEEVYDVPSDHLAWSVSVGVPPRIRSFLIVAPSPDAAYPALVKAVEFDENLSRYVEMEVFTIRRIDLGREGVW